MKITIHAIWLAASMTLVALGGTSEAVSITDFVVYGQQKVQIGVGSTVTGLVGSGGTVVGVAALVGGTSGVYGDVRSGTSVQLNNYSFVTGTVTNPGTYSQAPTATVGAHVTAMPDLPTLQAATVYGAGVLDQGGGVGAVVTLAPGSYRNVSLGGDATLNLTAGDYFFNTLTAGHGLDLNLNLVGGDVRVFVVGAIRLGAVDVLPTGGTAADIYFETHFVGLNAFQASGQVDWLGTVFAPYGEIHIGNGGSSGTFQGNLWSGTSVTIEHDMVGTAPVPVPEPATAALLALGLASLGVGHAWRKRAAGRRLLRDVA